MYPSLEIILKIVPTITILFKITIQSQMLLSWERQLGMVSRVKTAFFFFLSAQLVYQYVSSLYNIHTKYIVSSNWNKTNDHTVHLTIIPRTWVGYELLDSGWGAKHRVGYHELISNKREWNNCFIKYQTLDKNNSNYIFYWLEFSAILWKNFPWQKC